MTEREYKLAIKKYLQEIKADLSVQKWFELKKQQEILEKDPFIKEYIDLVNQLNLGNFEIDKRLLSVLKHYAQNTTHSLEIYYYNGEVKENLQSQNSCDVQYIDIETRKKEIANSTEFERNHDVLISNRKNPNWNEFESLQNWYFKTLIASSSMKEAKEKVKKFCIPRVEKERIMTEKELKKIKNEIKMLKKENQFIKKLYDEYQTLLKDPNVKRYIELTNQKIIEPKSDMQISFEVFRKIAQRTSSPAEIYYYNGAYCYGEKYNQEQPDYYEYLNLETGWPERTRNRIWFENEDSDCYVINDEEDPTYENFEKYLRLSSYK